MYPRKIYVLVCDLTHTAQTVASDFIPIGAGCVGAYLKQHVDFPVKIKVLKFLQDLESEYQKCRPDIIGFSCYMWNCDLTLNVAKIIKEDCLDIPIIFGGPNFPVEPMLQEQWLKKNPHVDFFIPFEGEKPFAALVSELANNGIVVKKAKAKNIPGICYFEEDIGHIASVASNLSSLDEIPSPYLAGYLDQYLGTSMWPVIQIQRGCPFQCAFCAEGNKLHNKVISKSLSLVEKELDYIAKRQTHHSFLHIADSNFLMFPKDLEVCRILARIRQKYNWPSFVSCSTGKSGKKSAVVAIKLLGSAIRIAVAVQSFDSNVLKLSKRKNIPARELLNTVSMVQRAGGLTYSELIACLPGETLATHMESLKKLVESNTDVIKHHTLLLLNGASFSSQKARKQYAFNSRWRAVTKSFGKYRFLGKVFDSVECEEVVVGTSTLSFNEYIECRKAGFIINIFYNDNIFEHIHKLIRYFNLSIWDWLLSIRNHLEYGNNGISDLLNDYIQEVKAELWPSRHSLTTHISKFLPEFLSGKRGSNLTHKYRALLLLYHVPKAFAISFQQFEQVANNRGLDLAPYNQFLAELKTYSTICRENIFDTKIVVKKVFSFDFTHMENTTISEDCFTKMKLPVQMTISHSPEQEALLSNYFSKHPRNLINITSLINRVPVKKLYPFASPSARPTRKAPAHCAPAAPV